MVVALCACIVRRKQVSVPVHRDFGYFEGACLFHAWRAEDSVSKRLFAGLIATFSSKKQANPMYVPSQARYSRLKISFRFFSLTPHLLVCMSVPKMKWTPSLVVMWRERCEDSTGRGQRRTLWRSEEMRTLCIPTSSR